LQCVTVCCCELQCVTVCYSVLQCVTLCYSVLQWVAVCRHSDAVRSYFPHAHPVHRNEENGAPLPIWQILILQAPPNFHPFVQGFCFDSLLSLSADTRALLCKRRVQDFHRAKIVEFVSFTGAFTGKYVVNPVKETCETVHGIPKETCQKVTRFDEPYKTACFWGVKETWKEEKVMN